MTTQITTIRGAAIRLLADGVASVAEVATLAGTTRQRVAYWAKVAGIDAMATREAQLDRAWKEAQVVTRIVMAKPRPKRHQNATRPAGVLRGAR